MEKAICNRTIEVNEEGFMINFSEWNKEIGEELAREAMIELSERHLEIIENIKEEHRK
jgi:tRNA 2-thiouridine synthesizing protein E